MKPCFTYEKLKSKKQHTCHICSKPILPGREHIKETQTCNGKLELEFRRHIHCDSFLLKFFETDHEDRYSVHDVENWAIESTCQKCPHNEAGDNSCVNEGTSACFECETAQKMMMDAEQAEEARKSVIENELQD